MPRPTDWTRERILVWAKTRPELSDKYKEVVCTGGVFEKDRSFVRLYPIPLRFMDGKQRFGKYQWISASIQKAENDPRPESYRVQQGSIELHETIPTERNGNWDNRAEWILADGNTVDSLEHLQDLREKTGKSIGIFQPDRVIDIKAVPVSRSDRQQFESKHRRILSQLDLGLDFDDYASGGVRPLTAPDFRFIIEFRCHGSQCSSHRLQILDWEIDALYWRHWKQTGDKAKASDKTVAFVSERVNRPDIDLRFFVGNMMAHPKNFSVAGFWYPKQKSHRQPNLLGWPPESRQ